jgi:uncharacterized protein (UPF0335 family)
MTDETQDVDGVAGARIKSFVERIERMSEEKQAIADDIKEIYAEVKGVGFDAKAIREIVKLRKIDREKRQEQAAILEMYLSAIGME